MSRSGHFPHFWTEGGPICSKVCHGTEGGPTVDVVRRDAYLPAIIIADACGSNVLGRFHTHIEHAPVRGDRSRHFHTIWVAGLDGFMSRRIDSTIPP